MTSTEIRVEVRPRNRNLTQEKRSMTEQGLERLKSPLAA